MSKVIAILFVSTFIIQAGVIGYLTMENSSNQLVYIDSNQLLNEYKGMKEARRAYQLKSKTWQSNIDTLVNEVENLIVTHEKRIATMSQKEVAISKTNIEIKQKELMNYQKAIQTKAAEEDSKMTQTVLAEVNSFLMEYGERNNYKIILAATNAGNILYAEKGLDITPQVLKEINEKFLDL